MFLWSSCFSSVLVFCVVFLFCLSWFCTLCIQCCQFLWINCLFFITPSVFSNVYLESLKSYQSVNLITIEDIWKCTFMYNTFMLLNVCPIILRWYYFLVQLFTLLHQMRAKLDIYILIIILFLFFVFCFCFCFCFLFFFFFFLFLFLFLFLFFFFAFVFLFLFCFYFVFGFFGKELATLHFYEQIIDFNTVF